MAKSLINRGVNLDPVGDWSKVGLQVFESTVPIGATPEYLAGHYMLQGAASLLPVMALDPQPNEKVLDMCGIYFILFYFFEVFILVITAAPGGKTTHIAQLMKNTGVLYSNDANRERIRGLNGNIQRLFVLKDYILCSLFFNFRLFSRLGVTNTIVTNLDGLDFPKTVGGFDRVLCDAPCSGLGVISRDPRIKVSKTVADIHKCSSLQKLLLLLFFFF